MPSPSIPAAVLVLGKTYTVSVVPELTDGLGQHSAPDQAIKILADQHPECERDTLLHEIIHAIEQQLYLQLTEQQVVGLGCGLYQVLTQNPALVKYVRGL